MKITHEMLNTRGACAAQVNMFIKLFPHGVVVTKALCVKHAQDFEWGWAANRLLSDGQWKAYNEAIAPAWKAYDETRAVAFYEATRVK